MSLFLSYLAIGVTEGLIYGLLALGLVLIYKGSRTLNFAHPYFGLLAAFVCWWLTAKASFFPFTLMPFSSGSVPRFLIAIVLSLAFVGLYGAGVEHGIMRPLRSAPRVVTLVATIAIAQGVLGIVTILFNRTPTQQATFRHLPQLLSLHVIVGRRVVTGGDILEFIVTIAVCVVAAYFFTRTKFGVAVRAASENSDAARLLGISADRVATFVWVTGAVIAGVAGILVAEASGTLDIATLSLGFLVRGLTAALIGGLTSLPGALVGGLIVGVTENLIKWRVHDPSQAGLPVLVFFLFVIAVLIVRPGGLFGKPEGTEDKVGFVPVLRQLPARLRSSAPANVVRVVTAVFVAVFIFIGLRTGPVNAGYLCRDIVDIAIVGVGLTVVMGFAGQISLGHWALAGVGAFASAGFSTELHVPYLISLLLAIATGMAISLVIGLPALRIRGPYLAIVTLGFNLACQVYLFKQSFLGGSSAGRNLTPPKLGPFDLNAPDHHALLGFSMLCLGLSILVARNLATSRTGRAFFALRENEKAAATLGVRLTRYKLLAFAVSGGIAALGGALYASSLTLVRAADYEAPVSLVLIAIVMIGGLGSPWGALLGALIIKGIPDFVHFNNGWVVPIGSGVLLTIVIVWVRGGLTGLLASLREKFVISVDELTRAMPPESVTPPT